MFHQKHLLNYSITTSLVQYANRFRVVNALIEVGRQGGKVAILVTVSSFIEFEGNRLIMELYH